MISCFFFFHHFKPKFKLLVNLFYKPYTKNLFIINRVVTTYKKFHGLLPDPKRQQFKAYAAYLRERSYKFSPKPVKQTPLRGLRRQFSKIPYYFLNQNKFRSVVKVNYRRQLRLWQQTYFKRLKSSFYYGKIRPRFTRRILTQLIHKNLLGINLTFSLNPVRLLHRVFSFLDRFFLRGLLYSGLIWQNFNQLTARSYSCVPGDFVHIAWTPKLAQYYRIWLLRQKRYVYEMGRNIRYMYRARRSLSFNRRKDHTYRLTYRNRSFSKIPRWLEINFLSMSFFIVKIPRQLTFASHNFNPYLNRLWSFY